METRYDIPERTWKYQISSLLKVKSLERRCYSWWWKNNTRIVKEKILKPRIDSKWYVCVDFTEDHKTKHISLHRLVAKMFIPNPNNKPEVNHKNGITTDYAIENLERVTTSENEKHKYKILWRKWNMYWKFWEEHNRHTQYILKKDR